jgi:hypothetical protein
MHCQVISLILARSQLPVHQMAMWKRQDMILIEQEIYGIEPRIIQIIK